MIRRTALSLSLAATAIALGACAGMSSGSAATPVPVTETIARDPQLSTLSRLVVSSGLDETLRGAGPYTVFAPNDDAFKAVPADTLAKLGSDKAALRALLSFHVVPGKLMAADVPNGNLKSVQGSNLAMSHAGGFVTVEEAVVQTADRVATNGVVHVVDRVLMPPKK